ncbi:Highly reducing polyketide synthase gloL, partial [Frankliniella fusca]
MAATQQFDYQAEQLLMNKMLILLKEGEDEGGGVDAGDGLKAASPRSGSLSSLRAGRKSPKQGKSRSKSESEEAESPAPPAELNRQSPARRSLLVRKGSAEASPTKGSPAKSGPANGNNTNGSTTNGHSTNGSPVNGSPTNGSAKKGKPKGGLLGLLSSKNKKNKERSERPPPPSTIVQKLPPLQRPLSPTGKPAGKQDAKLEVRRALAMEAQRLRAQQQQDVDAGHPRHGRKVPASPAGSDSLSPEQRRARLEAQAQQTESVLQDMHAQQVRQQGGARSPPSSPAPAPAAPASSRSPPPDLKLAIHPAVPQPSPRSPPMSPTSPISPGVQADRSLPSSPVVPLPSPRTLPSPTSPASPASLDVRRGPLAAQPTPPSSPKQASSVLLAAERGSPGSPPLSPTLSQLDGSPGQRRRAQAAAIAAKRAQSPPPGP